MQFTIWQALLLFFYFVPLIAPAYCFFKNPGFFLPSLFGAFVVWAGFAIISMGLYHAGYLKFH